MKKLALLMSFLGLLSFSAPCRADDEEIPFGAGPTTNAFPEDAVLRFAIGRPPFIPASEPPPSPATATNFLAIADDGAPAGVPPDTQGAVGPSNVVTMLNSLVRIQDRQGGTNLTTTLSNWWGFSATKPFDPRIVYDPYAGRWIATAAGNQKLSDASLLVAVSQTSDPTGTWYQRKLDADTNHTRWGDFPMVGFNKNWIVVTANMYLTGSSAESDFHFVRLWVFNKTNFYAGGTNAPTILRAETNAPKAFALAPSLVYDDTVTNMHLLTTWNTNALRVYALTGQIGGEQLVANDEFPGSCNEYGLGAERWQRQFSVSGHNKRLIYEGICG